MLNTATTMKWKLTQHHHYHTDHTTEATSAAGRSLELLRVQVHLMPCITTRQA